MNKELVQPWEGHDGTLGPHWVVGELEPLWWYSHVQSKRLNLYTSWTASVALTWGRATQLGSVTTAEAGNMVRRWQENWLHNLTGRAHGHGEEGRRERGEAPP